MAMVLGERVDTVRVAMRAAVVCLVAWLAAAVPLALFGGVGDPAVVLDGTGVVSLGALGYMVAAVAVASGVVAWLYSRPRGTAWWHAHERRWIFAGAVTAGQIVGVLVVCLVVGVAEAILRSSGDAVTMAWALAVALIVLSGLPLWTVLVAAVAGPGGASRGQATNTQKG